jgi:hypothetical protein
MCVDPLTQTDNTATTHFSVPCCGCLLPLPLPSPSRHLRTLRSVEARYGPAAVPIIAASLVYTWGSLADRQSDSFGHHAQPSPNAKPSFMLIYTDAPVFDKSVENAQLYTVGSGTTQSTSCTCGVCCSAVALASGC